MNKVTTATTVTNANLFQINSIKVFIMKREQKCHILPLAVMSESWVSYVLTFDVSVYDHVAVQVTHSFQDLPCVFTRDVFCQRAIRLELVFN